MTIWRYNHMNTFLNVLLVILIIVAVAMAVLYFMGRKLEKRQVEQQNLLQAAAQTVTMLVIDKKKLKIKDSNLPNDCTGTDTQVHALGQDSHGQG